jgi:hypothetical protein
MIGFDEAHFVKERPSALEADAHQERREGPTQPSA